MCKTSIQHYIPIGDNELFLNKLDTNLTCLCTDYVKSVVIYTLQFLINVYLDRFQ